MFNGIKGVFIRVKNIEDATDKYLKVFGGKLIQRHKFEDLGFDTSVIEYSNDTFIEIISPLSDSSPVQKALDKRAKNRKIKNLKVDAPTVENFSWKETLKKNSSNKKTFEHKNKILIKGLIQ